MFDRLANTVLQSGSREANLDGERQQGDKQHPNHRVAMPRPELGFLGSRFLDGSRLRWDTDRELRKLAIGFEDLQIQIQSFRIVFGSDRLLPFANGKLRTFRSSKLGAG